MTYIVVPSPSGSVSISLPDLVPITDGTTPAVGQVGYLTSATQAALTGAGVGLTNTWGSVISLALPAGVWEIQGLAQISEATAFLSEFFRAGVSDSATGLGISAFEYTQNAPVLTGQPIQVLTPVKRVSIAIPTTFYLNTYFIYASGTPEHAGILWAMRYS